MSYTNNNSNSGPSPGFLYFNNKATPPPQRASQPQNEFRHEKDTSSFLAFGDSPLPPRGGSGPPPHQPHMNRFSPNYSSSPKGGRFHNQRGSPRNFNPYNNRRHPQQRWSSGGPSTPHSQSSFNSSPGNNHSSFINDSSQSSLNYSGNSSFDGSNCSSNRRPRRDDIDDYMHPSFTEDPWKELMQNYLKNKQQKEEATKDESSSDTSSDTSQDK